VHVCRSQHRYPEPHGLSREPPHRALHARVRPAARLDRTRRRSTYALAAARSRLGHRPRRDSEHRGNVRLVFAREARQRRAGEAHSNVARTGLHAASDAGMTSKLARRIETLAAIEIALLLAAIIVAGALFAF